MVNTTRLHALYNPVAWLKQPDYLSQLEPSSDPLTRVVQLDGPLLAYCDQGKGEDYYTGQGIDRSRCYRPLSLIKIVPPPATFLGPLLDQAPAINRELDLVHYVAENLAGLVRF